MEALLGEGRLIPLLWRHPSPTGFHILGSGASFLPAHVCLRAFALLISLYGLLPSSSCVCLLVGFSEVPSLTVVLPSPRLGLDGMVYDI